MDASRAKGLEKGRVDGSGKRRAEDREKGLEKVAPVGTKPSARTQRQNNTVSAPTGRPLKEGMFNRGPKSKREVTSEVRGGGGRRGTPI